MIDLQIRIGKGYPIRIGPWRDWDLRDMLRDWPEAQWALVVDRDAWRFWADDVLSAFASAGIEPAVLELPGGEESKNQSALMRIYSHLQAVDVGHDGTLAVFGGGTLGDLVGFAAATWKSGIRLVMLPTTLHSQVDSGIRGMNGVSSADQRGFIDGIYQPSAVLISPEWLNSLDPRELRAGFAEVVTQGIIGDSPLLAILEREPPDTLPRLPALEEILARAISVRARIAEEETGVSAGRALHEFGHKVGHAIEVATGFARFLHGEAVALGTIADLRISQSECGLSEAEAVRVEKLLDRFGLPVRTNGIMRDKLLAQLAPDGPEGEESQGWVLTERLGSAMIVPSVHAESVRDGVGRILI